jgi:hypothetical protein
VKVVLHSHRKAAAEIVGIPYGRHPEACPVRALLTWLELLPADDGPVFRPFDRWGHIRQSRLTDEWVAKVVKRYVQSIGIDPDQFASHSLRVGLATSPAAAGASERSIMNQTRHRSPTWCATTFALPRFGRARTRCATQGCRGFAVHGSEVRGTPRSPAHHVTTGYFCCSERLSRMFAARRHEALRIRRARGSLSVFSHPHRHLRARSKPELVPNVLHMHLDCHLANHST